MLETYGTASVKIKWGRLKSPAPLKNVILMKERLFSFQDDAHALAATNTESSQTIFAIAALHFVRERNDDASAGAAYGVPE